MNAKRFEIILSLVMILAMSQKATAESTRVLVNEANKLYSQGKFNDAINKYDEALTESPDAAEPKFDKADSYYRLDDLANAMSSFEEVAAKSKDMKLVARAKYNLGNSYFQRGTKQKDSDLQKAIDDFKTSIGYWRSVLDMEPNNEKAAKNIEVARLVIKDLIDQLNKQKQNEPNQPQEPNQSQKQKDEKEQQKGQNGQQNQQQQDKQQQDQQQEQEKKQESKGEQKEPNRPADANQAKQQAEQKEQEKQQKAPDATAQEILDKEQKQRNERQMMQRGQYQKVDKDW